MTGIYKITSPNGKIYIGQSIDIQRRKRQYANFKCKAQPILYNSIKKYGWDKHKFDIVCECETNQLNILEKHYIRLFDSCKNGLNSMGGGRLYSTHSIEVKNKISIASKKLWKNEDHRQKMKNLMLERWRNPYKKLLIIKSIKKVLSSTGQKKKRSLLAKKIWARAGHKERMSKIIKKWKNTNESLDKISRNSKKMWLNDGYANKMRIKVDQMDLNGNFIRLWNSMSEANFNTGISKQHISKVCKNKAKTAGGFKWKYHEK